METRKIIRYFLTQFSSKPAKLRWLQGNVGYIRSLVLCEQNLCSLRAWNGFYESQNFSLGQTILVGQKYLDTVQLVFLFC